MISKLFAVFALLAVVNAASRYTEKPKQVAPQKPVLPEQQKEDESYKDLAVALEDKWCALYNKGDIKALETLYEDPFYYAEHTKLFTKKADYIKDLEVMLKKKKGHTCKQEYVSVSGCENEVVIVGRWFDLDRKGSVVEEQYFLDVLKKDEKGEYKYFAESVHEVGKAVVIQPATDATVPPDEASTMPEKLVVEEEVEVADKEEE